MNLFDVHAAVAGAVPERDAVVDAGDARRSHAQLHDRAVRLAHVLAGFGVGPGDSVGVLLHNRAQHVEALLAGWALRAAPVNLLPRYRTTELAPMLRAAHTRVLLHEPGAAATVEELRGLVPTLEHTLAAGPTWDDAVASSPPGAPAVPGRSGDDRYVLFTGGTTGTPKAVVWRHDDVFRAALAGLDAPPVVTSQWAAARAAAGRGRRLLPASPLAHGTAQWTALGALLAGGAAVLDPDPHLDAVRLLDLAERERVTFLVIVGDAFARPLVEALEASPGRWGLGRLSVILSGGAPLSPRSVEALARLLPGALVVDGYGTSETGGQGQRVPAPGRHALGAGFRLGDDTAVLGVDGRPLPPGSAETGRIARSGCIPLGYLDDEVASAAAFPVLHGRRWALTGDLARVEADGTVTLVGRDDAWINSGGEKVHPAEVEQVLCAHPDVTEVAVVGIPHPRWGEQVAAAVVQRPGSAVSVTELQQHCRRRLAGFKVPRVIVLLGALPRTPAGKPDASRARQLALEASSTGSG